MTMKVTVKTDIRVNKQTYANADAMPPDIREVYERTRAAIDGGPYKGPLTIVTTKRSFKGDGNSSVDHVDSRVSGLLAEAQAVSNTRIVFNGEEYASVEDMPAETRAAYEGVMAMLAADRKTPMIGTAQTNPAVPLDGEAVGSILAASVIGTARPESTTWRLVITGVVVAAMLYAGFLFGW